MVAMIRWCTLATYPNTEVAMKTVGKITDQEFHHLHRDPARSAIASALGFTEDHGGQIISVGSLYAITFEDEEVLYRVRRPHIAMKYAGEATIRTKSRKPPTEMQVIRYGDHQHYLYAYGTEPADILNGDQPGITKYDLLDLVVLRKGLDLRDSLGLPIGDWAPFGGGRVIRYSDYPGIIVASWTSSKGRLF